MTERHGAAVDRTEEWADLRRRYLRDAVRARLTDAGIVSNTMSGTSLYFSGPDGERLELIADPLGEMYGSPVV